MNNKIKIGKKILVAMLIVLFLFCSNKSYGLGYSYKPNYLGAILFVIRIPINIGYFIGMIIYFIKSKKEAKYKILVFVISLVNIILLNLLLRAGEALSYN